mgnify:FL=1
MEIALFSMTQGIEVNLPLSFPIAVFLWRRTVPILCHFLVGRCIGKRAISYDRKISFFSGMYYPIGLIPVLFP